MKFLREWRRKRRAKIIEEYLEGCHATIEHDGNIMVICSLLQARNMAELDGLSVFSHTLRVDDEDPETKLDIFFKAMGE